VVKLRQSKAERRRMMFFWISGGLMILLGGWLLSGRLNQLPTVQDLTALGLFVSGVIFIATGGITDALKK